LWGRLVTCRPIVNRPLAPAANRRIKASEIIGLARFRQGQKKIVRGIGRALHARQRIDVLGELLDLIDQAAGLMWFDEFSYACLLQRGPQLVDKRRAGQERNLPAGAIRADTMTLLSRTTRIRLC
jgi:hypothetical protein